MKCGPLCHGDEHRSDNCEFVREAVKQEIARLDALYFGAPLPPPADSRPNITRDRGKGAAGQW